MKNIEPILKVLSDKNRLRIFKMLEAKNCCVCELAYVLQIKQPSVSQHLKKMKEAGLINSEQDGLWTYYKIQTRNIPYLKPLLSIISDWIDQDNQIKQDQKQILGIDRCEINKKESKNECKKRI